MISIIVSSYNDNYFASFEESVANTVGVEYEIIRIYNPGKMGICQAYNLGIAKAKFSILCFSHEDIIMKTQNWGPLLLGIFENKDVGLVGIAGASYKSWVPSGWPVFSNPNQFVYKNIIQCDLKRGQEERIEIINPSGLDIGEVVILDGCWLCTTKSIAQEFGFDEVNFKGYHCYDLDFSLTVGSKYKLLVTFDIRLTHLSNGDYNREWLTDTLRLHEKWGARFPVFKNDSNLSKRILRELECNAYIFFFSTVCRLRFLRRRALSINFNTKFIELIGLKKWIFLQARVLKYLITSFV